MDAGVARDDSEFAVLSRQVAIGGFHMSGVISMIDGDDDHLREAQAMGLSVFASEAEGRLDELLRDAYAGQLKPLYNYMSDLPASKARRSRCSNARGSSARAER
jgi:hypothetical protein